MNKTPLPLRDWVLVDKDGKAQTWHTPSFVGPETESMLDYLNRGFPDDAPFRSVELTATTAPQAAMVQQEPVRWVVESDLSLPCCAAFDHPGIDYIPLYTNPAPQEKQPLTEEQIREGRKAVTDDPEDQPEPWAFKMGVWFAERHHGIKGE